MGQLYKNFTRKKLAYGGDWTNQDQQVLQETGLDRESTSGGNRAGMASGIGFAGNALNSMTSYGTGSYNEYRASTTQNTEAAMGVVSKAGPVGSVVGGIYGGINAIAKPIRNNAEATERGQLKNPKKAGNLAVAGAFLDPFSALSYRIKNKDFGLSTKKYVNSLNLEAQKEWQRTNGPYEEQRKLEMQRSAFENSDFANGNRQTQLYKNGGGIRTNFLANQKTIGGSMSPMSKDTTLAVGPSHAQGGIDLPNQNANVEGGETSSGNYIFSKELGFAKLHKPIAKSQGKIENKPATAERVNALNRLGAQTEQLKSLQELMKQKLNLQ